MDSIESLVRRHGNAQIGISPFFALALMSARGRWHCASISAPCRCACATTSWSPCTSTTMGSQAARCWAATFCWWAAVAALCVWYAEC